MHRKARSDTFGFLGTSYNLLQEGFRLGAHGPSSSSGAQGTEDTSCSMETDKGRIVREEDAEPETCTLAEPQRVGRRRTGRRSRVTADNPSSTSALAACQVEEDSAVLDPYAVRRPRLAHRSEDSPQDVGALQPAAAGLPSSGLWPRFSGDGLPAPTESLLSPFGTFVQRTVHSFSHSHGGPGSVITHTDSASAGLSSPLSVINQSSSCSAPLLAGPMPSRPSVGQRNTSSLQPPLALSGLQGTVADAFCPSRLICSGDAMESSGAGVNMADHALIESPRGLIGGVRARGRGSRGSGGSAANNAEDGEEEMRSPSKDEDGKEKLRAGAANGKTSRELLLLDPKRLRRVMANRMSAAKSKERKQQYTEQLEQMLDDSAAAHEALCRQLERLRTDTARLEAFLSDGRQQQAVLAAQLTAVQQHGAALQQQLQAARAAAGLAQSAGGLAAPPGSTGLQEHTLAAAPAALTDLAGLLTEPLTDEDQGALTAVAGAGLGVASDVNMGCASADLVRPVPVVTAAQPAVLQPLAPVGAAAQPAPMVAVVASLAPAVSVGHVPRVPTAVQPLGGSFETAGRTQAGPDRHLTIHRPTHSADAATLQLLHLAGMQHDGYGASVTRHAAGSLGPVGCHAAGAFGDGALGAGVALGLAPSGVRSNGAQGFRVQGAIRLDGHGGMGMGAEASLAASGGAGQARAAGAACMPSGMLVQQRDGLGVSAVPDFGLACLTRGEDLGLAEALQALDAELLGGPLAHGTLMHFAGRQVTTGL